MARPSNNDADDEAGQAADAALVLGEDAMAALAASAASARPVHGGDTTVVTSALFGKLIRKVVKAVAGVAKGAVDLVRKGLQAGAGSSSAPRCHLHRRAAEHRSLVRRGRRCCSRGARRSASRISLQGVTMRASRSVFLSTKRLEPSAAVDATASGQYEPGDGEHPAPPERGRICFTAQNGAGEIMKGFLPGDPAPAG
jgi:hypothetical protein